MSAQRVWITGASSGIGRALALEMARRGAAVVATARRAEALAELSGAASGLKGSIRAEPADVTDADALELLVARVEAEDGPIDTAILNAGLYLPVRAEEFDLAKFETSFAVNLGGTVKALAPILPRMMARKRGRIAFVASVAGYGGLPTSSAYGATKAALINMAESLKFDCDRHGVTVQVICPGFVETPATEVNPFPMPFIIPAEEAARRIADGLETNRFEIAFPRRFAFILKAINLLPYRLYFPLVARATGWNKPVM
ncbi:SDR family NAD(P)-dependent oxidoreductase [Blastochloris tepida]|uniref:Oxidoreductase n=1 Tax=Blastochloris tepida TaxID=2233851 RepID=A0A348FZL5_9HYPH|nr:SDR family NAD(P)-dependent oxidoreductase [Blastochloris tepida]BBF92748.1 oxidoreductase [Blastochloris tepida]